MKASLSQNTLLQLVVAAMLAITVLSVGCKSSAPNSGPTWVKLGERLVDFRADHDVIPVTANRGKFRAVKLRVSRAPIFIKNVRITYGNGANENIAIGKRIPPGTETRALNLPGDARIIRKVTFNYRTGPAAGKKAMVTVLGRR